MTFVELAHETLTRSNFADLNVSEIVEKTYLHRQESVLPDGDARQTGLLKTTIVLESDGTGRGGIL